MSRKHNTKHHRGGSHYKERLADRGLSRTPTMRWTGMSTMQIVAAFANMSYYRWKTINEVDHRGFKIGTYQVRELVK